MGFNQPFRVVGSQDAACTKQALKEARERARPLHRYWLKKVERAVVEGHLEPIDYLLAKDLTNYPSANEGRAYPGLKRLADKLGCVERTVTRSLDRLTSRGLLKTKRGAPGKTACRFLCFNGTPIFETTAPKFATKTVLDRTQVSDLDRTQESDKPFEPDQPLEDKPPPTPKPEALGNPTNSEGFSEPLEGRPIEVGSNGTSPSTVSPSALENKTGSQLEPVYSTSSEAYEGEIIQAEITFTEFWMAVGQRGREGVARHVWRKLSREDRFAIARRAERTGSLDTRGMHASTWLIDRLWEEPERPVPAPAVSLAAIFYAPQLVALRPHSNEWLTERQRKIEAGEPIGLMDKWAAEGRAWHIRACPGVFKTQKR